MIVIAIIAVIAAIAIPGLMSSQRAANERSASASLKVFCTAEIDFKSNDRDGNGISDFWTGDVAGLYGVTPASSPGDAPIKLINFEIAAADAQPMAVPPPNYRPVSSVCPPGPKAYYWYWAMESDVSSGAALPSRMVSDTTGFACHNISRFGFIAFPDALTAGSYAFITSESLTILKSRLVVSIRAAGVPPPGPPTVASYRSWPTDADINLYWTRLD